MITNWRRSANKNNRCARCFHVIQINLVDYSIRETDGWSSALKQERGGYINTKGSLNRRMEEQQTDGATDGWSNALKQERGGYINSKGSLKDRSEWRDSKEKTSELWAERSQVKQQQNITRKW